MSPVTMMPVVMTSLGTALLRPLRRRTVLFWWLLFVTGLFATTTRGAPPSRPVTGAEFTKALNRPLLVHQDYSPVKTTLNRLSADRRIAICLDRRIDPESLLPVDLQSSFFDEGVSNLVQSLPASVVVIADSLFVTTPATATSLRTRIALAEQQLENLPGMNAMRKLELTQKTPLFWDRLASPRKTLIGFAEKFRVSIENPEAIPHDLWDEGGMSTASFVAGASVIAAQYGLEIEWIDPTSVRLIPESPQPAIEIDHALKGSAKADAVERVESMFPNLKLTVSSTRLRFSGTVEEHEAVDLLLGNRAPRKSIAPVMATSLANRRFTLRMQSRPFSELIELLEKQGIEFDRNKELLEKSEINLDLPITLELENATIETLLREACSPVGLTYQIDGTRISLLPGPRPFPE